MLNETTLKDALHSASENVVCFPQTYTSSGRVSAKRLTKEQFNTFRMRARYGRGVVCGVVSALVATGMTLESACALCKRLCPTMHEYCKPEGWPL